MNLDKPHRRPLVLLAFSGSTESFLPVLWWFVFITVLSDSPVLAKKEDFSTTFLARVKVHLRKSQRQVIHLLSIFNPTSGRRPVFSLCLSGTIETELGNQHMLLPSAANLHPVLLSRACPGSQRGTRRMRPAHLLLLLLPCVFNFLKSDGLC